MLITPRLDAKTKTLAIKIKQKNQDIATNTNL